MSERDDQVMIEAFGADRYITRCPLANGGFGQTYLARDADLERLVVVKCPHRSLCVDPEQVSRFRDEAIVQAQIVSPNVARLYDYGVESLLGGGQRPYLVMEYIDGCTVHEWLHDRGRLDVDEAVDVLVQVLTALAALHARHMVYRDLKPSNLMREHGGRIVLIDLGIVRPGSDVGRFQVTRAGMILGTPEYMSPEQIQCRPLDARSDLYSVGVMGHLLLTGHLPFGRCPETDVVGYLAERARRGPPTMPFGLEVPDAFEAVIRQAMSLDPADRPADAISMQRALLEAAHRGCSRSFGWPDGGVASVVGEYAVPRRDDPGPGAAWPTPVVPQPRISAPGAAARPSRLRFAALALGLICAALAVAGAVMWSRTSAPASAPFVERGGAKRVLSAPPAISGDAPSDPFVIRGAAGLDLHRLSGATWPTVSRAAPQDQTRRPARRATDRALEGHWQACRCAEARQIVDRLAGTARSEALEERHTERCGLVDRGCLAKLMTADVRPSGDAPLLAERLTSNGRTP